MSDEADVVKFLRKYRDKYDQQQKRLSQSERDGRWEQHWKLITAQVNSKIEPWKHDFKSNNGVIFPLRRTLGISSIQKRSTRKRVIAPSRDNIHKHCVDIFDARSSLLHSILATPSDSLRATAREGPSAAEWEARKKEIKALYDEVPLKEVRRVLEARGFVAT